MKKLIALVLALAMVATLGLAFAENQSSTADGTGSVTINNPITGQTYDLYKIFDVTYNADHTAFSYTISSSSPFYTAVSNSGYFTLNQIGSTGVYNVINKTTGGLTGADAGSQPTTAQDNAKVLAAAFRTVIEGMTDEQRTAAKAATLPNGSSYTASGLALGYYFINSSAGALCTLDTTTPNVTVKEKNEVPTIEKEVKEGSTWGETSDGEIGDTVEYRTTIHAKPGAFNYVLYDKMDSTLTFNPTIGESDNIVVTMGNTTLAKGTAYTVAYNQTVSGTTYTFVLTFDNTWLKTNITSNTDIVVTYSGVINDTAVVAVPELNDTYLKYGDGSETAHDYTRTYTWEVDIYKYANGSESTPLAGATFKVVNSAKNQAATFDSNMKLSGWTDLASGDNADNGVVSVGTALTTTSTGKLNVYGFDEGTYYLVETDAPAGYNKLTAPVTITITSTESGETNAKTLTATVTDAAPITGDSDTKDYIKVNNQSGTTLPSTGGIGTTIFYILGGLLVVGAAVILVARRKASN